MKILITGIGNIGKSTLREKVASSFPDKIIQIDMDYFEHEEIPQSSEKVYSLLLIFGNSNCRQSGIIIIAQQSIAKKTEFPS